MTSNVGTWEFFDAARVAPITLRAAAGSPQISFANAARLNPNNARTANGGLFPEAMVLVW
jgi:hypothetical protein